MHINIYNESQLQLLHKINPYMKKKFRVPYQLPLAVIENIKETVLILDNSYGKERDIENDNGGHVLLMLPEDEQQWLNEYREILDRYKFKSECAEYKDKLWTDGKIEWWSELHLATEYGVLIIYCKDVEGGREWSISFLG